MNIVLQQVKPSFMSLEEIGTSDVYLQDTIAFEAGKTYQIVAGSGSGKTSLLHFLFQFSHAFEGRIEWKTETPLPTHELRSRYLTYMFQDYRLFRELTAMENVLLKNQLTQHKTDREIEGLFEKLGIGAYQHRKVATLSLGQQQRVAAIRAICQPFRFILLDEPFSHLDNENAALLANMIRDEAQAQQAGIIFTTLNDQQTIPYDVSLNL